MLAALREKFFNVRPAARVQRQTDPLRFVAQHQAKKFAGAGALFLVHENESVGRQQTTEAVTEHDRPEEQIA